MFMICSRVGMDEMINEQIFEHLNQVVTDAGRLAELPCEPVRAFDGDGWRWTWGDEVDDDRFAEIHVLVQDDLDTHKLLTEIHTLAWLVHQPRISYAPAPVRSDELTEQMTQLLENGRAIESATDALRSRLWESWNVVSDCSKRLEELENEREARRARLQNRLEKARKKRSSSAATR
jgi:hypothetical protein